MMGLLHRAQGRGEAQRADKLSLRLTPPTGALWTQQRRAAEEGPGGRGHLWGSCHGRPAPATLQPPQWPFGFGFGESVSGAQRSLPEGLGKSTCHGDFLRGQTHSEVTAKDRDLQRV